MKVTEARSVLLFYFKFKITTVIILFFDKLCGFQDLELASAMALGIRSPIPLGAVATQLYRIVQSRGYGQKDFSYIYQLLKEEAKK